MSISGLGGGARIPEKPPAMKESSKVKSKGKDDKGISKKIGGLSEITKELRDLRISSGSPKPKEALPSPTEKGIAKPIPPSPIPGAKTGTTSLLKKLPQDLLTLSSTNLSNKELAALASTNTDLRQFVAGFRKVQANLIASDIVRRALAPVEGQIRSRIPDFIQDRPLGDPLQLSPELLTIPAEEVRFINLKGMYINQAIYDQLVSLFPFLTPESRDDLLAAFGSNEFDERARAIIKSIVTTSPPGTPFKATEELVAIGPEVRQLKVSKKSVSRELLQQAGELFPRLRVVILKDCRQLTNGMLEPLSSLKHLKVFSLYGAENITAKALEYVPKDIIKLGLSFCDHLNDKELALLKEFSNLQKLDLSAIDITGDCILHFPNSTREVTLAYNTIFQEKNLAHLLELPRLEKVTLRRFPWSGNKETAEMLCQLMFNNPKLSLEVGGSNIPPNIQAVITLFQRIRELAGPLV